MPFLSLYLTLLLIILGLMALLWLVSLALKNSSIVDIFWGTGFVIVAWTAFLLTPGSFELRKFLLVALVTIWGLRLSLYILWRNWGKGEDFRYQVWRKEAECAPCVIFWAHDFLAVNRLKGGLKEKGHVFVADQPLDSGKVKGISPERADALFQGLDVDDVIVEADGAAGRPVKAPATHEPVVPSSATLVIASVSPKSAEGFQV